MSTKKELTFKDWEKKYYPTTPSKKMTKRQALNHSIRKWSGLNARILKQFGLTNYWGGIQDSQGVHGLEIDAGSCALCVKYLKDNNVDESTCFGCPLFEVRHGKRCDQTMSNEKISPYHAFTSNSDPKPMQRLLAKAKKMLENE